MNSKVKNAHSINPKENNNRFPYYTDKSNWLSVKAKVNNKDSAIFVFDNSTPKDQMVLFDERFALQSGLIKNNKPKTISHFLDSSVVSLSFGSFKINSKEKAMANLPQKDRFKYVGLIGYGFLRNYIIEINYREKYFIIDSTLSVDTSNYYRIDFERKGMYCRLPVTFYINGKKHLKNVLLDLGYQGDGFYWGGGAVKSISYLISYSSTKSKRLIGTMTGEIDSRRPYKFDSATLPTHLMVKNIDSWISFSSKGMSGMNLILLGNSFLSKFGKVYIDFRKSKLYLEKEKNP